ncbi:hypothetical protein SAMN04244573_02479 [Azotobacter beijerinckii]|uniref:Uncharacterized protein n=1 Tax=Azotobacter beijerinckii TaxID=170623 RepID=A0A1H9JT33_9GAMM|nr:hypothetical protein [Azotobacter beijerinckii]SEQ90066.1 hypothetical protein SAMN04244573_02479 [Azotobacter beijerinckii]
MTAKTAAERKRAQREREAERLKRLGHRVMQLELYQGTADALDRLCQIGGFEQPAEVITLLIHSADQIAKRDPSRFAELVRVTRHEASISEGMAQRLDTEGAPEADRLDRAEA